MQERASFIADRGKFLLEVLGVVRAVLEKPPLGVKSGGAEHASFGVLGRPEVVHNGVFRLLFCCLCEGSSDKVRSV
jgi:hypothetical protein